MRRIYFTGLVVLFLVGCVRKEDWTPAEGALPDLVVEAILTDEAKAHTVKLTRPSRVLNADPEPVTGAGVVISNEDSVWQLSESPAGSGVYRTAPSFAARTGKTYTVLIAEGGREYTARSGIAPGEFFNPLRYVPSGTEGLYRIDWVANAFTTGPPAMWEVLADWSRVPGYGTSDSASCRARMLFYSLPTLDVSEIFAPMVERVEFPAGTVISERRYSLTDQQAAFLRELLMETSWAGGMFPVASSNVSTNLSDGAAGYFMVCSVTELSLIVTPPGGKK